MKKIILMALLLINASHLLAEKTETNWLETNVFEHSSTINNEAFRVVLDYENGLATVYVNDEILKKHKYSPKLFDITSFKNVTEKLPLFNIESGFGITKRNCGGAASNFDSILAVYVLALNNGANQAVLDNLASAVTEAFFQWMACLIK